MAYSPLWYNPSQMTEQLAFTPAEQKALIFIDSNYSVNRFLVDQEVDMRMLDTEAAGPEAIVKSMIVAAQREALHPQRPIIEFSAQSPQLNLPGQLLAIRELETRFNVAERQLPLTEELQLLATAERTFLIADKQRLDEKKDRFSSLHIMDSGRRAEFDEWKRQLGQSGERAQAMLKLKYEILNSKQYSTNQSV